MNLRLFILLALTVLATACGDGDGDRSQVLPLDAGARADAASASDVGSGADDTEPLYADPERLASVPGVGEDSSRCVESDADARGAPIGCEQMACRAASRACCVGRAECCSPTSDILELHFDTCIVDCVDGALFGSPLPTMLNGFSPGGDADFDSGVVLDQRVDLRGETIRLAATFVVPTVTCSGADCFQTVGVSVARNAPQNSSAHVHTIAGLLWSGGRVYLIVGERSVKDWAAEAGGLWSLEIDADGDVRVESTASENPVGETFIAAILPSEAYIVLHGHNVNPGGGDESAQLSSLVVSRRQCEMTRQWSERTAIEVGSGLTNVLTGVTSPTSVHDAEGRLHIAYIQEGRLITTFRGDEDTPNVWVDADDAYDALQRPDGTVIAGPELANENGNLVLYYEVDGQILRADRAADDGMRLAFTGGQGIMDFNLPGASLHAPTLASRGGAPEAPVVVRVEYEDDRRSTLAAFSITTDNSGAFVAQLHDLLPTDSLGEELGDPELFIRNRLYQLYVPYRIGTRWRLAHLTSEDFLFWNIADDKALESGGADELFGPRAPSAVVSQAGVELFYERFDGVEQSIGRVFRRTPEIATLQSAL